MVRAGRERLSGVVQLDETFLGGPRAGNRGRGAAGKTLVAMAVEQASPQGAGRLRLAVIPDASAASLTAVATAQSVPGTTVQTDDWQGYGGLPAAGYPWQVLSPEQLELPQLVAARRKRWLLGTYQGAGRTTHLAYYLDEFTFRFNRRSSRQRGKRFYRLGQQAAIAERVAGDRLKAVEPAAAGADYDDLAF